MMHNKSAFPPAGTTRYASGAATAVFAIRSLINWFLGGILLVLIQLYRWFLSPAQIFLFGGGSGCRFTPTCSQYAAEAIRHHGAVAGGVLALKRICRCHPFGDCGIDPVPQGDPSSQCRKERCD